ncbi:M23 family metallopeptidase [Marinicella gelatinilytica]|uniref:M23 family metallopeptidase n=1 Tax=Marinicella gelatinilytica TaxID=2996017 RepID=UPI00226082DE|nr:M23 family metallopeptidase [Marinicella gelatinilytica]MCX7545106.1 M23 family metallopeptidase [Marinicella gelatinilytica]
MQNVTILKQNHSGIKQYSFADRSFKFKVYGVVGLALAMMFTLGMATAPLLFNYASQSEQDTIQALQARVEASQSELNTLKKGVQNDIDAMTLQIGQLMAQSTRLNALGSRLTAASDINADEFDLNNIPGLGGAELELTGDINTPQSVYASLFSLEQSFEQQQEQFDVLSRLLNEQSIEQNVTPHMMPLESGWISSYYGKRIDPFTGQQASHSGMDYSGAYQSKIRAAADGVVVWAGPRGSYGRMVEIDHGNGFMTRYAHAEEVTVELGQRVTAGDHIGTMGKTGRATSEHLHFEVLKNGHKVNPLPFIHS